jgi:hypothetical protein
MRTLGIKRETLTPGMFLRNSLRSCTPSPWLIGGSCEHPPRPSLPVPMKRGWLKNVSEKRSML